MPLKIYKREDTYWFKGRIDELPNSKYYRQSTHTSSETGARAFVNDFQQRQVKIYYAGHERVISFADAVMNYKAKPEYAKALGKLIDEIGQMPITSITPKFIRNLGSKLQPYNCVDTWQKRIVSPVRAVINNAHDLGLCPPIKIKSYSEAERIEQDKFRGKLSRVEKEAADWDWILSFISVAPTQLGALAVFMFMTGARIGQSTAIVFDDFDAKERTIILPAAKGTPAEKIHLTESFVDILATLKPRYTRRKSGKMVLSEHLFGYLGRDSVYSIWKRVCRDANIKEIMPHAAGRHGFATEMIVRNGIDPVTVAKMGRWKDILLLFKTYSHAEGASEKVTSVLEEGRKQAEKRSFSYKSRTTDNKNLDK